MKKIILPLCVSLGASLPVFAKEGATNLIITSSRVAEPQEEVATSVTVLTQEDIEAAGYSSVAELLRTVGAIGVSNSGGEGKATALRIRGEESYRTLVMIDGVDVSDPTGTQVGPQIQHLLLNGDIERIEILRGAQGFIYGADAGGVVNIFTVKGRSPVKANLKLEAGAFDTKRINANVSGGNSIVDYFFSIGDNSSEGFNSRKDDTSEDNDGYENTTIHGKFGINPTEDMRVQLVVRDIESESEFDNCFAGGRSDDCMADYQQTTSKLSFDYNGAVLSQHVAYAFTDITRENFANGSSSFGTDGDISRLEYWGGLSSDKSRIIYGLDLETEDVTSSSGDSFERDQLGIYLEYKARIAEQLFFNLGVRQDDNDDFGKYVSERASLAYLHQVTDSLSLKYRTSFGTGFRAPSISEISYNNNSGGVELQEETSKGYEYGVDVSFKNGFVFSATYFDQLIKDEIFFDLNSFLYDQETGETESTGVELTVDIPLSNYLQLYSNYTYNDTKDRNGEQRARRPRHLANLGLKYYSQDNRFTLRSNLRVSRDAVDNGQVALDDYALVDLNAAYELSNRLSLFASIKNVFDEEYEEISGFNTAGQNSSIGLRYRL